MLIYIMHYIYNAIYNMLVKCVVILFALFLVQLLLVNRADCIFWFVCGPTHKQ